MWCGFRCDLHTFKHSVSHPLLLVRNLTGMTGETARLAVMNTVNVDDLDSEFGIEDGADESRASLL